MNVSCNKVGSNHQGHFFAELTYGRRARDDRLTGEGADGSAAVMDTALADGAISLSHHRSLLSFLLLVADDARTRQARAGNKWKTHNTHKICCRKRSIENRTIIVSTTVLYQQTTTTSNNERPSSQTERHY